MNTTRWSEFLRAVLMHPLGIPAIVAGLIVVFLGGLAVFTEAQTVRVTAPVMMGDMAPQARDVERPAAAAGPQPSTDQPLAIDLTRLAPPAAGQQAQAVAPDLGTAPPAMHRGAAMPLACLIEASAVAEVGTPVTGVIEKVLVERGDIIQRGQVLALHENRLERAAVTLAQQKVANNAEFQAAKSQLNFAQRKARRTSELTELNYVSGQAREQAETELTLARMRLAQALEQRQLALKELDMAKAQLQQRTITSPLDGVVVDRLVSPGERVENRPVFKVAKLNPLRVEVVLPSTLLGRIQVGHTAHVTPDMPDGKPYEAQVSIVDRVVDAGSNTFRARLSLPNPTQQVPAGVRCKIDFGG